MKNVVAPQIYQRRAKLWLISALALALLWVLMWFSQNGQPTIITKKSSAVVGEIALPNHIDKLNDFGVEVVPVNAEQIEEALQVSATNEKIKDKGFLEKYKDKWTVEVMDSTNEQLVEDYLATRKDDHQDFSYFRYTNKKDGKKHFILMYKFTSQMESRANAVDKLSFFKLPKDYERAVYARPISDYLKIIDEYNYDDEKAPIVSLAKTNRELPAKPIKPKEPKEQKEPKKSTTTTTSVENSVANSETATKAVASESKPEKEKSNSVPKSEQKPEPKSEKSEQKPEPKAKAEPKPKETPRPMPVELTAPPTAKPLPEAKEVVNDSAPTLDAN